MAEMRTYTATKDINDETSPYTGLKVEVLDRFGMSYAGFDCLVRLHTTPEDLAARFLAAGRGAVSPRQVTSWHDGCSYGEEHRGLLVIEANEANELSPTG